MNHFRLPRPSCFLLPALACLLASCSEENDAVPPPPTVTVAPVREQVIQDSVVFTGRTVAVETVEVRARVSGYLTETKFKDGQDVKKGDVLFVIDPRPYQADLDRAQAEFDKAQADLRLATIEYNRAAELRQKNAISAQDFDAKSAAYLKAQGGLASAKADLDTAKLNL
jgi:multidrug efflux system membrane fusion protein